MNADKHRLKNKSTAKYSCVHLCESVAKNQNLL